MYVGWGGAVAADMLEWYRKEFRFAAAQKDETEGDIDWDALMSVAAASPAGCKGLMFLPHMSGVSFPIVDPRSLGSYVGLNQSATQGDMLRAIIEGLDYQFLDIVKAMESGLGVKPEKIVAVGGAVRNRFWMQNKADVVGRPIEVPEVEEATALGAAILAGIGVGLYKNEQDAFDHVYKQGETFEPNPKLASLYDEGYRIYEQLYPALKPISHQLYDKSRGW
jgi:xylulokinase